jgi:hypothetical protein
VVTLERVPMCICVIGLINVPMGPSSDLRRTECRRSHDELDRPACDHMKSSRSNLDLTLEASCFDLPSLGTIPKRNELM